MYRYLCIIFSAQQNIENQFFQITKGITASEIFVRDPEVKKMLWGGQFWSDGYFIRTVGKHGNEDLISSYVKNQGKSEEYKIIHKDNPKTYLDLVL